MNRLFSTIGLIARHSRPEVAQSLLQLAAHLDQQGLRVIIDRDTQQDPLLAASAYPQVERAQLGTVLINGGGVGRRWHNALGRTPSGPIKSR